MKKTWLCSITLITSTRPGIIARVAQIFSERGISLEQVLASSKSGQPNIYLVFASSERLRDYLVRRLRRIAEIAKVKIEDGAGRSVCDVAGSWGPRAGW
jgi:predicted regulator of amino acid metabolism with ACT domain